MIRFLLFLIVPDNWKGSSSSACIKDPVSRGKIKRKKTTKCPGNSDPFHIVTYYIKWVTTSWTDGMKKAHWHNWIRIQKPGPVRTWICNQKPLLWGRCCFLISWGGWLDLEDDLAGSIVPATQLSFTDVQRRATFSKKRRSTYCLISKFDSPVF